MALSLGGIEREARKHGFFNAVATIGREDFYISCRWSAGEAAPRWTVDGIPTPIGQVDAIIDNSNRESASLRLTERGWASA